MIAYLLGTYDILRERELQKLDREIQKSKERGLSTFALGIYDENLCEMLGIDTPLKSIEDRMKIMEQIRGVDFVFPISTLDKRALEELVTQSYRRYQQKLEEKQIREENKKYRIGYAPGTYDLFHAGHLENLILAYQQCQRLIVGVKADELVEQHKNKKPIVSANERMAILRYFKFVQDVYQYYTRDPHVANDWIKDKYGYSADAIFYGSDLERDFSNKDVSDLNIVFTKREEKLMSVRSTTAYRKLLLGRQDKQHTYKGKVQKTNVEKKDPSIKEELDI